MSDPKELLKTLIRFDTSKQDVRDCIQYIRSLFEKYNIETHILAKDERLPNLIARIPGKKDKSPLLLYGHIDVYPPDASEWDFPPFSGIEKNGYIHGCGALDMKSGVAMMISALLWCLENRVVPCRDIILCLTPDEEWNGEYGAQYLTENHKELFKDVQYGITEGGGIPFDIFGARYYVVKVAEKHVCNFKIKVNRKRKAHALMNREKIVERMTGYLSKIKAYFDKVHITPVSNLMIKGLAQEMPFFMKLFFNLLLSGNIARILLSLLKRETDLFSFVFRNTFEIIDFKTTFPNFIFPNIPDSIEFDIYCNLLPGKTAGEIEKFLLSILDEADGITLYREIPSSKTVDLSYFDTLSDVLKGMDKKARTIPVLLPSPSDARWFDKLNIQTYGFTPMQLPRDFNVSENAHGPNEKIPANALTFGTEALYRLITKEE